MLNASDYPASVRELYDPTAPALPVSRRTHEVRAVFSPRPVPSPALVVAPADPARLARARAALATAPVAPVARIPVEPLLRVDATNPGALPEVLAILNDVEAATGHRVGVRVRRNADGQIVGIAFGVAALPDLDALRASEGAGGGEALDAEAEAAHATAETWGAC